MQYLLSRAVWDADEVRDDVRAVAVECLGDTDAMLIVDETGDLKKVVCSVGVQRSTPAPPDGSRTLRSGCF